MPVAMQVLFNFACIVWVILFVKYMALKILAWRLISETESVLQEQVG